MPKLTAQERRHYKARLTAALVASAAVPAEMAPELAAHLLSWDAVRIEFDRLIDPTMKARLSNADRAALAGAYMSIGVLRPIKSGGSVQVGGISVPKRYAVGFTTLDPDDPAAERARRREIKALDMRICVRNPDYLLRHPLDYEAYRFGLTHLSDWLRDSRPDAVEVTRKERSYEIWGSEKALDRPHFSGGDPFGGADASEEPPLGNLLSKILRLDIDRLLLTRDTQSPSYASYILPGDGAVVVSENKDMYCDIESILQKGGPTEVFGRLVRGVVEGGGWAAVDAKFSDFAEGRGVSPDEVLYVGDIDRDGIAILGAFIDRFGGEPFGGAYARMVGKHMERAAAGAPLNRYTEDQSRDADCGCLEPYLTDAEIEHIGKCLASSVRIPQEILTASMLAGGTR